MDSFFLIAEQYKAKGRKDPNFECSILTKKVWTTPVLGELYRWINALAGRLTRQLIRTNPRLVPKIQ